MILKLKFNFIFKIRNMVLDVRMSVRTHFAAILAFAALLAAFPSRSRGQENYFVTYSHQMEEPGNLEIAMKAVARHSREPASHTNS